MQARSTKDGARHIFPTYLSSLPVSGWRLIADLRRGSKPLLLCRATRHTPVA